MHYSGKFKDTLIDLFKLELHSQLGRVQIFVYESFHCGRGFLEDLILMFMRAEKGEKI